MSSLAGSPSSDTLSSITSCDSLQSPHTANNANITNLSSLLQTSVSTVAALDNLPSFTGFSDSYTQSIMTTIEPRVFGAEAEYINRLKTRRDSCPEDTADIPRHSVIVSPSQKGTSPEPELQGLSALTPLGPFHSYLSDNASDKILLKEEPEVTSKVDEILLSTEFGGPVGGAGAGTGSSAAIPNFLHFTPDESVTQSVLSQCNKHSPPPSLPELDQPNT